MTDRLDMDTLRQGPKFRLQTIVRLRWAAIAGQTVTVLVTRFVFGFDFPWLICLVLIAVAAAINLYLIARRQGLVGAWIDDGTVQGSPLVSIDERVAFMILSFDIAQLGLLVLVTGGMTNPFAIFVMAPVLAASTTMNAGHVARLGLLAVILVTMVAVWYVPLPWYGVGEFDLPRLYIWGHWTAIVLTIAFTVVWAYRSAEEARRLAHALAATELVMQHEQSLASMDGLAAAAAHELGTPLGTITMVANELRHALPEGSPEAEDVALIVSQAKRCRDILGRLQQLGVEGDAHMASARISALLEDLAEPHRGFGVRLATYAQGTKGEPEPIVSRNPSVMYALSNLVENAVDFAEEGVAVRARWDSETIRIEVADDGPGFSPAVLERLGDPFVSKRASDGGAREGGEGRRKTGMGLGVFITKTLVERTGGRISFANARDGLRGGRVLVLWPRAAMEGRTFGRSSAPNGVSEGDTVAVGAEQATKPVVAA